MNLLLEKCRTLVGASELIPVFGTKIVIVLVKVVTLIIVEVTFCCVVKGRQVHKYVGPETDRQTHRFFIYSFIYVGLASLAQLYTHVTVLVLCIVSHHMNNSMASVLMLSVFSVSRTVI